MVVVIQQTAHTRPAANRPAATGSPERLNQFVADALMVPLTVVVRHEIRNRATKMALPQQDHALKAFDRRRMACTTKASPETEWSPPRGRAASAAR
jgi:hypothetical protein